MNGIERIALALSPPLREKLRSCAGELRELRLRAGQRPCFVKSSGSELRGEVITPEELRRVAAALMEYSLYAWEDELAQGYFTIESGCRVGVSGRLILKDGAPVGMRPLQAICVRVAREAKGCADALTASLLTRGWPDSLLLVSRPGLGKTTCLRDVARQLSERGFNVGVADERGELAAVRNGLPALDIGPRTDVIDHCPKHLAIPRLVRAMAPDVLVTDELGDSRDAEAVLDARRCGVAVIASAHAASIEEAFRRPALSTMASAFDYAALLDGSPGHIAEVRSLEGMTWR